jgi:hypothetical protein
MKEGFEPKSFKNYNLTPEEQKEIDKFLDENWEKGYIQPSQLPQASPFFFVKKQNGRLQPCQDYWYLNDWTIKNAYPLPLISEIMDKLKGAKYFSKFDVQRAMITFKSNLEMNGKPHSKQIKDYTNPLSCSLECVTLRQLSKL